MIIQVNPELALPVYEQIREQIVRMVVAGTVAAGTRMPTIRQLANDLQLAKGTVAKAYALLEESNVLESRGHKGTFIAGVPIGAETDSASLQAALGEAAETFAIAAKQLGVDADTAAAEVKRRWDRI